MHDTDVLVLGGGMAGASAALAAAGAGARTILVRSGPGATSLCGGGWTGAPPAAVQTALASAGLELAACPSPLPHPDGRLLHYDLAAPAQARAAPDVHDRTLVCGIAGLPAFRARALATLWAAEAGRPPDALASVTLTLPDTPPAGWSAVSLAAHLDRAPDLLAAPLARAVREAGATHVILPAVLGMDRHDTVAGVLMETAGVTVGEALGAAPSLPGWRLDRMLLHALEQAGVRVINGCVTEHVVREGAIRLVMVAAADAAVSIAARAVVLATGKFLGGGITAQARFVESALHTDVSVNHLGREITDARESLALTDALRTAPQPILRAGVRTDGDRRPVSADGTVAFHNVVVAGSVRAGTETASLGLGSAAHEGWDAGTSAARMTAGT